MASAVAALIREVVASAPNAAPLVGVGVGVPGLVRRSDGLVRLAPNMGWHDVDLAAICCAERASTCPCTSATTPTSAPSPSTPRRRASASTTSSTSPAASASAPA